MEKKEMFASDKIGILNTEGTYNTHNIPGYGVFMCNESAGLICFSAISLGAIEVATGKRWSFADFVKTIESKGYQYLGDL